MTGKQMTNQQMRGRFDASTKFALAVAAITLVLSGVGFRVAVGVLNVHLQKEPVALRGPLTRIPTLLGPWQRHGEDAVLSAAVRESLGTDQYLDRGYRFVAEDGPPVGLTLHIAYYTGMIDTVPHVPERCWGAAGMNMTEDTFVIPLRIDDSTWIETDMVNLTTGMPYRAVDVIDPISRRLQRVHMPVGDFELRVTEFQAGNDPDQRYIGGYFFIANGRLTSSAFGVRSLAFQASERYAYYTKVQLSMPASANDPDRFETYRDLASDLLSRMLPHLMRQLPDWPTIERSVDEPSGATPAPAGSTAQHHFTSHS